MRPIFQSMANRAEQGSPDCILSNVQRAFQMALTASTEFSDWTTLPFSGLLWGFCFHIALILQVLHVVGRPVA